MLMSLRSKLRKLAADGATLARSADYDAYTFIFERLDRLEADLQLLKGAAATEPGSKRSNQSADGAGRAAP